MASEFTFHSTERLKSKRAIDTLFRQGHTKVLFPLKIYVIPAPENNPHPVKLLVSVPKKKIKSAVERNRVKRLLREAWRLNKPSLYQLLNEKQVKGNVMLLFLDKFPPDIHLLQKKMPSVSEFITKVLSAKRHLPEKPH